MTTSPVIEIQGLAKSYGRVRALDGLSLSVPAGPVGLLGPNGSGKTTLLKLLLGLLAPDQGTASIAGHDPARPSQRLALRAAVGYMPEGDCLMPGMSALELTSTLGRLSGLAHADAITRSHEVLDYVGLHEARYRNCEEYSTGMKQRLKLAQAIVHDPPILLLDEPTNGLDPQARRHMLELVHDLGHAQGKNLLLCSHLLLDVERTCADVIVLKRGRAVLQGSIAELTRSDGQRFRVRLTGNRDAFQAELAARGFECSAVGQADLSVRFPDAGADADPLFEIAARAGTQITELSLVRSSLEEIFLHELARESER